MFVRHCGLEELGIQLGMYVTIYVIPVRPRKGLFESFPDLLRGRWHTFIHSMGGSPPLAEPNWIIDVTRPEDGFKSLQSLKGHKSDVIRSQGNSNVKGPAPGKREPKA